jgi:hypothetical protein
MTSQLLQLLCCCVFWNTDKICIYLSLRNSYVQIDLRELECLSVDWGMEVSYEEYNDTEEDKFDFRKGKYEVHRSVRDCKMAESKPLSIHEVSFLTPTHLFLIVPFHSHLTPFFGMLLLKCFDSFTKEDKVDDTYCPRCKELKTMKMAMSIWRLPPILVIHLKRFQYTERSRRKLHNLVKFPINGFVLCCASFATVFTFITLAGCNKVGPLAICYELSKDPAVKGDKIKEWVRRC